jgi:2-keto-4-pentenoate hydratase/2-oxohepta-3-ene-1,7-dioic acid hydratase in catechol pathway
VGTPIEVRDGRLTFEADLGDGLRRHETCAIYTIGANYRSASNAADPSRTRPLVYGKVAGCVAPDGATLTWDRGLSANVQGECELGVVLGRNGRVFGYTIVNDVTSQDPWLDGDQWLLGKSMPGFCPVGPQILGADEIDPSDLRLRLALNDTVTQDGRTSHMRFSIPEVIAYLGAHVTLRPGDLIATGTPPRIGPLAERHLQPGDVMACWIESIGTLTTTVA